MCLRLRCQPRATAQPTAQAHPTYTVPRKWGEFKQSVRVGSDYLTVFQADNSTICIVQLQGMFGEPVVQAEIARR